MSFPKWGGLPEVTSKVGREGFPPLPSVYSSAVDALNADFHKEHGKTVEQAVQESDEALRKIADLIPKDSNKTVDQVMQESQEALRKIQSFVSQDDTKTAKDEEDPMTTVFPAWVQPEDDETTWWQSDGNATADDMATVFPAVR